MKEEFRCWICKKLKTRDGLVNDRSRPPYYVSSRCKECDRERDRIKKSLARLSKKTDELDRLKTSSRKDWRKQGREFTRGKVRERDNHTCQSCRKVWTEGRRFDVHHLNGVCGKKSKAYDSVNDIAGLITLCHKCHYSRHDFAAAASPAIKARNAIIRSMRKEGKLLREIAEQFNISHQLVSLIVLNKVGALPKPRETL